jgi:hypothetical protein
MSAASLPEVLPPTTPQQRPQCTTLLLKRLCDVCSIALAISSADFPAGAADFPRTIYDRAQELAAGMGYRLVRVRSGWRVVFVPVELPQPAERTLACIGAE